MPSDTPANALYKIVSVDEWRAAVAAGAFTGAAVDHADGFIHLSAAHQVRETATKHFGGRNDLMLVAVDPATLPALKWEVSRGGDLFPHSYAPLDPARIFWAKPLPLLASGEHDFAGLLP